MKKLKILTLLTSCMLLLTSCENGSKDHSSNKDEEETTLIKPGPMVNSFVEFKTFDEYLDFYNNIMKKKESDRYVVPVPSDEINTEYYCLIAGINMYEAEAGKYDGNVVGGYTSCWKLHFKDRCFDFYSVNINNLNLDLTKDIKASFNFTYRQEVFDVEFLLNDKPCTSSIISIKVEQKELPELINLLRKVTVMIEEGIKYA